MARTIYPTADFSSNRIGVTPPDSILPDLKLWAYFGGSLAESLNLVDGSTLATTGSPTFAANYVTITPGTNYLTPTSVVVDTPKQTILFVARTQAASGGYSSPIYGDYAGSVGSYVALGSNDIRLYATGFGTPLQTEIGQTYPSEFNFWSVTFDSGAVVPMTWKNWTHNVSGSGGTTNGARSSCGAQQSIGGFTVGSSGNVEFQLSFKAKSDAIMTSAEIERCYLSVKYASYERDVFV